MSIGKIKKVDFSAEDLRDFAKKKFGTIKNMAEAMGISPPQLHAYLSGKRNFGALFKEKLDEAGFFDDKIPIESENLESKQSLLNAKLDISGALELSNTPAARMAQLLGVTPATFAEWQNGTAAPTPDQLATLFNMVVALALSSRPAREPKENPAQATG